jgi:alpha-L-rhamnosidase
MHVRLINANTRLFVDGLGTQLGTNRSAANHSAWHAQTSALWLRTAPKSSELQMLRFLREKGMVGSVYGAYALLMGLYEVDSDHGQLALEMMVQCSTNSWCHMLSLNATATMEAWDPAEKPNLSWSHPWATAPATAIVRGFMGLTALEPTFRQWQLKPQPGNASWAQIRVPVATAGYFDIGFNQSMTSFVAWISAPTNTIGRVCLPKLSSVSRVMYVDGVKTLGTVDSDYVCVSNLAPQKERLLITVSRAAV